MINRCNYLKSAIVVILLIIITLWCNYFYACLDRSQQRTFPKSNNSLAFIEWVSQFTYNTHIESKYLFYSEFYLLDFPAIILFSEAVYIVLIIIMIYQQKRRLHSIVLCVSLIIFFALLQFLSSTLVLFVPG